MNSCAPSRSSGRVRSIAGVVLPVVVVLLLTACDGRFDIDPNTALSQLAPADDPVTPTADETSPASPLIPAGDATAAATGQTVSDAPVWPSPRGRAPAVIRGLYLNAYAAGSSSRLSRLLEIADRTEINTFVIDVKDERGPHYASEIPLARELTQEGEVTLRNLPALLSRLEEHGIHRIARIVVFNDPILSKARPEWSIRNPDGGVWLDRSGNSWVSPWEPEVWEYNIAIAEEVARAGFDEIQFDYVRFPEQFQSLPRQVHPAANGDRTDAIAEFLERARQRLHPLGVIVSADVFGLSPNTYDDVAIGQQWERLASIVDHILPMMYPSHYYSSHLPNVSRPNAMPYETIYTAAGMARLRTDRLRDAGLTPARVIVWLQAFQAPWLRDGVEYGPEEVRAQIRALYDVGLDDWILWHPGSQYEPVIAGVDTEAVPRAKSSYDPPAHVLSTVDRFESLGIRAVREQVAERLR